MGEGWFWLVGSEFSVQGGVVYSIFEAGLSCVRLGCGDWSVGNGGDGCGRLT